MKGRGDSEECSPHRSERTDDQHLIIKKDINISYFRIALEEVLDRFKLCSALSQFIDDVANEEKTLGKTLVKLGSTAHPMGQSQWLPTFTGCWEEVYRMSTEQEGSVHLNFSTNISTNICLTFPEHVKASQQQLLALQGRINFKYDELRKSVTVHAKNCDAYLKLLVTVENALNERNAAQQNCGDPALDDDATYDTEEQPAIINAAMTVDSNEQEADSDVDARDSSFCEEKGGYNNSADSNRTQQQSGRPSGRTSMTFSRMLSKISTGASSGKPIDIRCKELMGQLLTVESQLSSNGHRLMRNRRDLLQELENGLSLLEEIEVNRLIMMRDGVNRIYIAAELMASKQKDAMGRVLGRTEDIKVSTQGQAIIERVEMQTKADMHTAAVAVGDNYQIDLQQQQIQLQRGDSMRLVGFLFQKAEKMSEALEAVKVLTEKTVAAMQEIADAERTYAKKTIAVLNKHGYRDATSPCNRDAPLRRSVVGDADTSSSVRGHQEASVVLESDASATGDTTARRDSTSLIGRFAAVSRRKTSSSMLNDFESPRTQSAWRTIARAQESFADLRSRTAEFITEEVCQQLDAIWNRNEVGRRQLLEKVSFNRQMVQDAASNTKKAIMKLDKLRVLLTERRSTLRAARLGSTPLNGDQQSSTTQLTEEISISDSSNATQPQEGNVIAPIYEVGTSSNTNGSGASTFNFRATTLKQVVGLESQADRVLRIEKQISSLEDEQRELTDAVAMAEEVQTNVATLARSDMQNVFEVTCEVLTTDLDTMKRALEFMMHWKKETMDFTSRTVEDIRKSYEGMFMMEDIDYFVRFVQRKGAACEKAASQQMPNSSHTVLEIPTVSEFIPPSNVVIDKERSRYPSARLRNLSCDVDSVHRKSDMEVHDLVSSAVRANDAPDSRNHVPEGERDLHAIVEGDDMASSGGNHSYDTVSSVHEDSRVNFVETVINVTSQSSTDNNLLNSDIDVVVEQRKRHSPNKQLQEESSQQPYSCREKLNRTQSGSLVAKNFEATTDPSSHELGKFGLSPNDKVLEFFSCALYPEKGILTHGKMFVTQHFIAFSGWPDTRVLLSLGRIKSVNRTKTLMYIPNAITIVMEDGSEYFFSSFIERELCYKLLSSLSEVAKRITEIHGQDISVDSRNLEFGYQTRSVFSGTAFAAAAVASARESVNSFTSSGIGGTTSSEKHAAAARAAAAAMRQHVKEDVDESILPGPHTDVNTDRSLTMTAELTAVSYHENANLTTAQQHLPPEVPDCEIDLTTFFPKYGIHLLKEEHVNLTAAEFFRARWLLSEGYGEILEADGNFGLRFTEWMPWTQGCIENDVTRTPFQYSRTFDYLHPRTTFTMVGPKNAPTGTVHYLYLPKPLNNVSVSEVAEVDDGAQECIHMLSSRRPRKGIVMVVTQFEGIPMSDVFVIYQYWTFEEEVSPVGHLPTVPRTMVRAGLNMHYVKSTMFKGQIFNGTRDELVVFVRNWFAFVQQHAEHVRARERAEGLGSASSATSVQCSIELTTSEQDLLLTAAVGDTVGGVASRRPSAASSVHSNAVISAAPGSEDGIRVSFRALYIVAAIVVLLSALLYHLWLKSGAYARRVDELTHELDEQHADLQQTKALMEMLVQKLAKGGGVEHEVLA